MARLKSLPGLSALIACLALLLIWDALARAFAVSGLPPPWGALRQLPSLLSDPETLLNILASLRRMAIGFFVALACAVPVGLMMGRSAVVAAFFNPLFMVIYPVPKAALMPLIMLWIGVGDMAKVLVIFLGVSLPVVYHSFQGARAVEEKMLWSAAAMGLSARARLLRVVLPAACRRSWSVRAPACARAHHHGDERDDRPIGVGNIFFTALDMAQYDTVYAMIIIIGALGFACEQHVVEPQSCYAPGRCAADPGACSGMRCVRLSSPRSRRCRHPAVLPWRSHVSEPRRHHLVRLFAHCPGDWGWHRHSGCRQPNRRCLDAARHPGAGPSAEDCALPGVRVDARV